MSNIKKAFENGNTFIPFITCADPDLETTAEIILSAVENGADLIELGIPFSDPTAEGPVIQEANIRALSTGITTDKIFNFVSEIRNDVKIPLVFMTYANVVFSYGIERFMQKCAETGIDGIIIPDIPFEEKEEFAIHSRKYGVDMISLIAPAPANRIEMIAKKAEGFVYIVPNPETTETNIKDIVSIIHKSTDIPCAVGLDISSPEQTEQITEFSDGVIAGTAIIKIIEKYGKDSPAYVGEYIKNSINK